jgi:hypothetical protein
VHRLVVLVVPVFALLMACEFAWGWFKRRNTYRFSDTLGSLSQGLLSQALAVCTQLFQIGLYAMVYPLVAIWDAAHLLGQRHRLDRRGAAVRLLRLLAAPRGT